MVRRGKIKGVGRNSLEGTGGNNEPDGIRRRLWHNEGTTMSSSTDPISLPAADIPKAGEMLARSFHNDPMTCHLLPDAAKRHTPFRHWYLQLLGVDPGHQGQGYATALVNPMLARFDREGLPCCLDTMNGDNVAFYERFGFRVAAKSLVPKTQIGLWLMARGD